MSYFKWNVTELYYEIKDGKTPVLLIHGWGIDHNYLIGCMEPVFQTMGDEYQRIYVDLPGMGKSTPGNVKDGEDIVTILIEFMKEKMQNRPVILVGNSFGGLLCCGIAKREPELVSKMILITPSTGKKAILPKRQIWMKDDQFLSQLSQEDRDIFAEMNARLTKDVWDQYEKFIAPAARSNDNNVFLNTVLQGTIACNLFDEPVDQMLQKPVLFIAGKQDNCVGYEDQFELSKHYAESTYVALEGAGHNLVYDQPEAFSHYVTDWLLHISQHN